MKRTHKLIVLGAVMVLVSLACGITGETPSPTLSFPTPDLTLTAMFGVLDTLTAVVPTATIPEATSTAPPSSTPIPTDTPSLYLTPIAETLAPTLTSVAETTVANASATPTWTPSPSWTWTPSITPIPPTVTPTPMSRSGPSVMAYYFSSPPAIDGSLGDWELDWINVNTVVFGKSNWQGASDLSAKIMVGWDMNYLYLGVKVTDDIYAYKASGSNLYMSDSLEVLLDANLAGDYHSEALSSDDYQLGISAQKLTNDDKGEAYLWYPSGSEGNKSKVIIQGRPTDEGYRMEVAIPWSVLGVTPQTGQNYGFVFSVNDNDDPNNSAQQSVVSNVGDRKLTDPTTWGNLTLKK
jgi:hypothetical protein